MGRQRVSVTRESDTGRNERFHDNYKGAKNGWTWPPITEILGQIKRFYLDTKNGKYLDTFLDKPLNQFYLS